MVIELKRNDYGGHMDLQAIRYAAMVAGMTFEQVVSAHEAYLTKRDNRRWRTGPPLRKRQAVLTMIQKLSQKGVKIEAVSKMLPPSHLRVISGQPEGQAAIEDALRAEGVNEPQRYFTQRAIR